MLMQILSFYLQGLLYATVLVLALNGFWLFSRAVRKLDKTIKERQAMLYETLLISVMVIPILAFAMMGLLLVIRV